MSAPVKLVVDCTNAGALPTEQAEELASALEQSALELLRQADASKPDDLALLTEKATALIRTANEARASAGAIVETVIPLTDDEVEQQSLDALAGLEIQRNHVRARIEAALSATDRWAARASEEGTQMAAPRVKHRQKLRALFADVDAASDLEALDAIVIPPEPAPS